MTAATAIRLPPQPVPDPKPMVLPGRSLGEQVVVKIFVLIPFVALVAAVPIAWGWGLGWTDLALAAGFCLVACLGATVGYHRYFTHRASQPRAAYGSRWR
jgi:stearoyl-CoA desaturase (Delta-9 desaturase)